MITNHTSNKQTNIQVQSSYIDIVELEKMLDKTFLTPVPKSKEDAERWHSTFLRIRNKLNHAGKIINRDIMPDLRNRVK